MRKYFLTGIAMLIVSLTFGQNENLLKPGDAAPPLSVYKWLKGNHKNSFDKGRVYVIEFGSTWCAPCKAMIPVLSSLQKKYKDDLSVISVFVMEPNENEDLSGPPTYLTKVKNYIEKQGSQITYDVAVDDAKATMQETWLTRAGKIGIPYTFIIDKESRIAWIGSNPEMLRTKLDEVISGKTNYQAEENTSTPTGDRIQELPSTMITSSSLSPFIPTQRNSQYLSYIPSYARPKMEGESSNSTGVIKAYGQSLTKLYYLAYSDSLWNLVLTRSPKTKEYPDTIHWTHLKKSYGKYYHMPIVQSKSGQLNELFNYDLQFKTPISAAVLQNRLRSDLQKNFNLQVTVESRSVPCWIITIESLEKLQRMKTSTQDMKFDLVDHDDGTVHFYNADMRDVIAMLATNYGFLELDYGKLKVEDQGAFIDQTNIKWKFNFVYDMAYSFDQFKKYLQSIGLAVSKSTRSMKVVVINDPVQK